MSVLGGFGFDVHGRELRVDLLSLPAPRDGPAARPPTAGLGGLRNQFETVDVAWSHDAEVAAIESGNGPEVEPLGGSHHGGVDGAERQVGVLGHEFGDPQPVGGLDGQRRQRPAGQVAKELDFGRRSQAGGEQIRDLGDHQLRHEQRVRVVLQQVQRVGVMSVVSVDVGVERAGIDQQTLQDSSSRRISSIRAEISWRPLRPAAAASS
jgi:hypothetical protein